jgi:hypothetical protein
VDHAAALRFAASALRFWFRAIRWHDMEQYFLR